ncbi:MAG: hypothetical protein JW929_15305 [Anaerolineales bacterium]|nr:hypothetical protein [Anaerolineales bacterium]
MAEFLTDTWNPLCELFGSLLRPLGGLVFGVAVGWLTASVFLDAAREWQLKIAIFLGLLGSFVAVIDHAGIGTAGMLMLGTGAAVIAYAVMKNRPEKKKEK